MFQSDSVSAPACAPLPKQSFDDLCQWIEAHIEENIGWPELMQQSGLEYQIIQALFFRYAKSTAMTWMRRRREAGTRCLVVSPLQTTRAAQQAAPLENAASESGSETSLRKAKVSWAVPTQQATENRAFTFVTTSRSRAISLEGTHR